MGRARLDDLGLRDRLLDQIRAGHGRYEAARIVGLKPEAFRRYTKNNPEFRDQIEAAVEAQIEPAIKMLRDEGLLGDITALKEYLKWSAVPKAETQKVEVSHEYKVDAATLASIDDFRARLTGRADIPELPPVIEEAEYEEDDD